MIDYTKIISGSLVSEKSHTMAQKGNVLAFIVHPHANKYQIRDAVEKLLDVKVASINTVSIRGKKKSVQGRVGKRSDIKKAYVTLQAGQDLMNFVG